MHLRRLRRREAVSGRKKAGIGVRKFFEGEADRLTLEIDELHAGRRFACSAAPVVCISARPVGKAAVPLLATCWIDGFREGRACAVR
jgi:hypothetical protein